MTKIQRSDFTQQHANRSVDLNKLDRQQQSDPAARADLEQGGLSMDQLRQADRNRDGTLDATEAFRVADNFDRDGSGQSLIAVDRAGQPTQAGKAAGALGALLAKRELQPDRPANDDILFVGMNPDSTHEARNLAAGARGRVTAVHDSAAGDGKIKVGTTTYDLTDATQRLGFAQTLGLPPAQTHKVADAIGAAGRSSWGGENIDGMDEVAQIAQVWAKAERGEDMPSRMVISGHHVGDAVWGDDNGQLSWDALRGLAQAMPEAAGRVEDLHIAACYSGGDKHTDIFPNLKTVWAYSGSAPGSWSGAMAHQKYWEQATRGGNTDLQSTVDRLKSWGTRKAENIAAGAVTESTYNGPPLSELRQRLSQGEPVFQAHFSGQTPVADQQNGPLRGYYNQIQTALQHPDLPAAERSELQGLRDQCIRTLFYDTHIRSRFQQANAAAIRQGYQALGLSAPNFAILSRADAMASIRQYQEALAGHSNPPAPAQNLLPVLNGLWNLSPDHIPQTWI